MRFRVGLRAETCGPLCSRTAAGLRRTRPRRLCLSHDHLQGWQHRAACLGLDPDLFHPNKGDDTTEIKRICWHCPVRRDCLNYAVRAVETLGIWGGVAPRRRRILRQILADGDPAAYDLALDRALDRAAAEAQGLPPPDEWQPATVCERCGDPIAAGYRPDDINTPGATCGLPSTFNAGCRCERCKVGKVEYQDQQTVLRNERSRLGSPQVATGGTQP